jgi:hypothetical protein
MFSAAIRMLWDETDKLIRPVERTYRTFYAEPVSGYDHSFLFEKKTKEGSSSPDVKGDESD